MNMVKINYFPFWALRLLCHVFISFTTPSNPHSKVLFRMSHGRFKKWIGRNVKCEDMISLSHIPHWSPKSLKNEGSHICWGFSSPAELSTPFLSLVAPPSCLHEVRVLEHPVLTDLRVWILHVGQIHNHLSRDKPPTTGNTWFHSAFLHVCFRGSLVLCPSVQVLTLPGFPLIQDLIYLSGLCLVFFSPSHHLLFIALCMPHICSIVFICLEDWHCPLTVSSTMEWNRSYLSLYFQGLKHCQAPCRH